MINLLPPQTKEDFHYGRRNRLLMHWIIASAFCLVGALLLVGGGYLYLNQSINDTTRQIADTNKQLQDENLNSVQKQVTDISNNLKLTVEVLSKEILFSKLLDRLATVTPSNTILTSLSISQTEGAIEITAQSSSYQAATQLQTNLADPKNQIFSKADIESIACQTGPTKTAYPCTANIRALFGDNNPFLFINDQKGTK